MSTTGRATRKPATTTGVPPADRAMRATGAALHARAPYATGSVATGRTGVQALAVLLRQLRTEHGFGTRRLADRAGVARSTIVRLERGQLRPRPSTLGWVAGALNPDRRAEIRDQLVAAAGEDLAAHDEAWARYQIRRMDEALQAGRAPLPLAMARQIRLTVVSEAMHGAAVVLADQAGALLDRPGADGLVGALMDVLGQLREESDRLAADAGDLVHATPPRRWRGDPPDASLYAPHLSDLAAVRQWVREWQVREGRLRPRSAREHAIMATGERERQLASGRPEPRQRRPRATEEGR